MQSNDNGNDFGDERSDQDTAKRPDLQALEFSIGASRGCRPRCRGRIWTRPEAEVLLGEGADVVAPWRSAIPNPDRPKRVSNPAWEPTRPPFTIEELRARGLGKRLAENMGRKKGFVL
jgi:hypothetical protein